MEWRWWCGGEEGKNPDVAKGALISHSAGGSKTRNKSKKEGAKQAEPHTWSKRKRLFFRELKKKEPRRRRSHGEENQGHMTRLTNAWTKRKENC